MVTALVVVPRHVVDLTVLRDQDWHTHVLLKNFSQVLLPHCVGWLIEDVDGGLRSEALLPHVNIIFIRRQIPVAADRIKS